MMTKPADQQSRTRPKRLGSRHQHGDDMTNKMTLLHREMGETKSDAAAAIMDAITTLQLQVMSATGRNDKTARQAPTDQDRDILLNRAERVDCVLMRVDCALILLKQAYEEIRT